MTTPKIYSKTQICSNLVKLGCETDIIATFDTPEKAFEFSQRVNQAMEDIFNDLTEPEMTEKEREMVEKCIALSTLIRAKSDDMADLLECHYRAWQALCDEFGTPHESLALKPYEPLLSEFGEFQQEIQWLQEKVWERRIKPQREDEE